MYCPATRTCATALFAALASIAASSTAYACSKTPVSIQRWSSSTVLFLGNATADSVRTGPGDVEYRVSEGHFGRAGDRIIHGQLVDIESLSPVDRKLLPAGVKQVVLVPWDYGADCRPTPWTRTARWMEPGTRGIYQAELRGRSHWLNGVPVLDVYSPEYAPYTGSFKAGMRSLNTDEQWLTIDELFALVAFVPDPELLKHDAEAATRALLQWAEQHAELAGRHPAQQLVFTASYNVSTERMRRVKPDIGGTWRFTFEVPGVATRIFYGRTHDKTSSAWPLPGAQRERKPWELVPLDGFYMRTLVQRDVNQLPVQCSDREPQSYMAQRVVAPDSIGMLTDIGGDLDPGLVTQAFLRVPGFTEYKMKRDAGDARSLGAPSSTTASVDRLNDARQVRALFHTAADGVMRVRQEYSLPDGRVAVIRGERISRDVVKCDW